MQRHHDLDFIVDWNDAPIRPRRPGTRYQRRALAIWPGLDHRRLRRTGGDPWRIARLVATRTSLPFETIVVLLLGDGATPTSDAGALV